MKDRFFNFCAVSIPLGIFYLAGRLAAHFLRVSGQLGNYDTSVFIFPESAQPETLERTLFLAGILFLPLCGAAILVLLRRWDAKAPLGGRMLTVLSVLSTLGLAGILAYWFYRVISFYSSWGSDASPPGGSFRLDLNAFWSVTVFLLILWLLRRWSGRISLPRTVVHAAAAGCIVASSLLLFISDHVFRSFGVLRFHFQLPLGSIIQVLHGKTILVDVSSQYGILYPYVAGFFTRLPHLSIQGVSVFFVLLTMLTWGFLYLALYGQMWGKPLWALLSFVSLLGIAHPFFFANAQGYSDLVYYQYIPIRMVFGAFFLWFVPHYLAKPARWKYVLGFALSALSLLWNTDTGLVVVISWAAFLVYQTLACGPAGFKKKLTVCLGHAAASLLACSSAVLGYSLFAWVRSGQWPDWFGMFEYQGLFYRLGYFMLPMRNFDLWNIFALIYLVTMVRTVAGLFGRDRDPKNAFYFFTAVYGIGILSYFQGRSHVLTLSVCIYPALLLNAWYLYQWYQKNTSRLAGELVRDGSLFFDGLAAGMSSLLLVYGLSMIVSSLPSAVEYVRQQVLVPAGADPGAAVVSYIQEHARVPDPLIIAEDAEYYYLETGTYSPLPFSSLTELISVDQLAQAQSVIDTDVGQIFLIPDDTLWAGRFRYDQFDRTEVKLGEKTLVELVRKD